MVDDQYENLKNLNADLQKRMGEQIRELDFKDSANIVKQINSIRGSAQKELNELLLPHQAKRLRQLQMQSQFRRRSLVDIITSEPVKAELEVTDEQEPELRKAEKEIEEELQREIEKLRLKAREKLISKLKPKQEKKFKEMVGDLFEFPDEAREGDARKGGKGGNRFQVRA